MMANRVQNGTLVQGPQVQPQLGFFRKMRRSLTKRGTRRSRSESPTPTGRNLVCVDIPALDTDTARPYVGHTVDRSRDITAVPLRPRIAPLVKTEDLEPDLVPNILYAQRSGIGGKDICDEIPIPELVKGDPQLRHCGGMDENANKQSEKKISPQQEIQELILDFNRDYTGQGARPKTRSVPQLYHADELGTLHIQTVTCEPVIITQKTEILKSADDDETDDEYDYHGDLKAYCVSYKMPDQESPEGVTIKQEQLISEMKPKTPSDEDEDDGDDDAGVYLEAHTYTESDTLPNGTGKDDAIIAIQGELLTDSSKSMSGSDEENSKTPRGSGNMEPLIITMSTEIETDSKTMRIESRTPHIAEVLRRHSFPNDALDLKEIVLSQETKEDRKKSPEERLSQKSISPGKEEFEEVMLLKESQLVNHSPTSHSSIETDLDACKRKSQDDIKSFCLRNSSSSSSTHSAHSIHSNHSTHSSHSSHSSHSVHQDAMDVNGGPNGAPPAVDRSTKPRYLIEAQQNATAGDYAESMGADGGDSPPPLPPREQRNLQNLPDENNIERMLMNLDHNFSDDDSDNEPTHVRLEDVLGEDFKDLKQKNEMRSRSLPRQPMRDHHSPLRKQSRGSVKTRLSRIFLRGRKRHSTLGFPDRPLPDVPPERGVRRFNTQPRSHSYVDTTPRQMPNPPIRVPDTNGVMNGTIVRPQSREELERTRGEFATSLRRISEYGWYWGPMSWDDAEMRLENMPDGSFLVRDSSDDRHILSLSFRAQGSTHHTRIEHHNGKFSFWSQPSSHGSSSIVEFIEEAMQHSRNGRFLYFLRPRVPGFPPAPVQLLFPISRFQKARSLQHMCRFVIRRQVRLDHIDELPLPRRLRDYLKEGQYYTPDDIIH